MSKRNNLYVLTAWIPTALLVLCYLWAGQYEGWGGWAAGAVFLIPLSLSAVMGLAGIALLWKAFRDKAPLKHLTVAALTASFPILLFVIKVILHEIRVSF